jgi:NAD(P)-dependent dehydrogenase (short-subunit alcohol dehydrogenase family)
MDKPVVLITGGLTGIGRAAAVAFAKKGAKVVVAGRRDEAGKALVEELRAFGAEAEFINADVRKEDDVHNMVGTAENKAALATQVPLGRLGLSEEVADGIVFIASNEAKFITGHVLNVDGGHSAN